MNEENILFYKVFHNENNIEIARFDSFDAAKRAADNMIELFKYWGGGAVPVRVESCRWTKAGKYKDTPRSVDYSESLYIDFAREKGNLCGFMQEAKRKIYTA